MELKGYLFVSNPTAQMWQINSYNIASNNSYEKSNPQFYIYI